MAKVISRDSINNANDRMIRGEARSVSRDSRNVSMKCHTSFGTKNIVVSREQITTAAASALAKSSK